MQDIYFEENYGKLYEHIENGRAVDWRYDGEEGTVRHLFIVRKIPIELDDGPWFDLVTPYGYGGPVIERLAENASREALVAAFEREFGAYCKRNKIVSEFIRFHPIIENAKDFAGIYSAECIRRTVGTNLKDFDDPVTEEFSKGCRKSIRQALNKGVIWRVTTEPEKIDGFKKIYYATMDRNHANDYYYFDDKYFDDCIKYFKNNLVMVEAIWNDKTIAGGIYFIYGKFIHVHLSGTLSEYLNLNPAYVLKYATVLWGKENGFEMIHYGGGKTNDYNDSLFQFKKKFGQHTEFPFYVGRRIWNKDIYKALCLKRGADESSTFFPAYRMT